MFLFHCWFCFISDDSVCYCCCSFGIFVERLLLLLVLFLYQSVFAIFTRLTFFAIFVNRCIAVSNVCISFDIQPRLFAYLHSIRVVFYCEWRRKKKIRHISHRLVSLYSDWKIEHSNSCNSNSIWAMQSPPPTLPRFFVLLLSFVLSFCMFLSWLHYSKNAVLLAYEEDSKPLFSFFPFCFAFSHFKNLGNSTHPITALTLPYSICTQSKIHTISIESASTSLCEWRVCV